VNGTARGIGGFVVLVGPDGVGKTSVARALIEQHHGPSAYFHFLPPLRGPLPQSPGSLTTPPPAKAAAGGSAVLGWVRLVKNAIRCWFGYWRTVHPALGRHWLIIGDRWVYGYLVQPEALRFQGPDRLARLVIRLLPRPDLTVNLSAPANVIHGRKQELTLAQIEQELASWSSLQVPNLRTLDATRPPHEIAADILAALAGSRSS
jgi:thymidylate kinase